VEKALVMSESGDWFLVPWDKRETFWEDELEEKADYADYIGSPSSVKIKDYALED
jgi:hypothetical protein